MKRPRGRPRKHPLPRIDDALRYSDGTVISDAEISVYGGEESALKARQEAETAPEPVIAPEPQPDAPSEISVRLGLRGCMTSRGPSVMGSHIHPGAIVPLPAHEAENLINLGYATRA